MVVRTTRHSKTFAYRQYSEAGEAPSAVMRVMGFARTVIYDWLQVSRVSRRCGRCRFRDGHPSLTDQQRAVSHGARTTQFEFALWTRAMVRRSTAATLSLASVGRLLRSLGLTPQRPVRRAIEQVQGPGVADGPILRFRRKPVTIFFADEAGVRSNAIIRAPRGRDGPNTGGAGDWQTVRARCGSATGSVASSHF